MLALTGLLAMTACADSSNTESQETVTSPPPPSTQVVGLRGSKATNPTAAPPQPVALRTRTPEVEVSSPAVEPRSTQAAEVNTPDRTFSENTEADSYNSDWAWNDMWPGEWPDGFTVEWENVVLTGFSEPEIGSEGSIKCPVIRGLTVHPWNKSRIESDDWQFKSATYRSNIDIIKDGNVMAALGAKEPILKLRTGEQLRLEAILSEGFIKASYKGQTYEFFDHDLRSIAKFEESKKPDLWANIICNDKDQTRAWLKLDQVSKIEGVGPVNLEKYGHAEDL